MSTQILPVVSRRATRLLGPLFAIGGLLWVADFVQIVINGAMTGSLPTAPDPLQPLVLRIGVRLFVLSIVVLGLGLVGMFVQVQSRSTKLAISGLVFTAIALVLATVNLTTLSGVAGPPMFNDTFMGLSIFATAIATALLSVAALRTHAAALGRDHAVAHWPEHHTGAVWNAAASRPRLGNRSPGLSHEQVRLHDRGRRAVGGTHVQ